MNLDIIKQERNMQVITSKVNELIQSDEFVHYATDNISDNVILEQLPKFKLNVVASYNNSGNLGTNEAFIHISRFKYFINSKEDLLEQFLHDTLHEIAWKLWKICPVKYSDLSEMEADIFDEIWGQAYIYTHFPNLHHLHWKYVERCMEFVHNKPEDISEILRLFQQPTTVTRNALTFPQKWIYTQDDVACQETFSTFMQMCKQSLKNPIVKTAIANYTNILTKRTS